MNIEPLFDRPLRLRLTAGPSAPRKTVERLALLVEDEWLIRIDMANALEAAGWMVAETNSGEEALRLLAEGEKFDLVVLDIRLHGTATGWDVADAFRARRPEVGVVYASANPPLEDRILPGSVFLSKPVSVDALVATCERIWKARKSGGAA
jgi:CheY-like chemotaxis protein